MERLKNGSHRGNRALATSKPVIQTTENGMGYLDRTIRRPVLVPPGRNT